VFGRSAVIPAFHDSVQISNRINSPLGFSKKKRFHDSPDNSCGKVQRMNGRCMTQTELAERWRTESNGPLFLKLGNQVRYRVQDVEAFEEVALRGSTKTDGGVEQAATDTRPAFRSSPHVAKSARPITIWLRTGSRNTRLRPVGRRANFAAFIIARIGPLLCKLPTKAPAHLARQSWKSPSGGSQSRHCEIASGWCHERNSCRVEFYWSPQHCQLTNPRWPLASGHAEEPENADYRHGVWQRVLWA